MTNEMIRTDRGPGVFSGCEGKYLTFSLAGEEYGIGIKKVKEIIGTMPIRSIPQTPSHLKGVINLRGKVIPVVELRLKFGISSTAYTERTCIVVVEIHQGDMKALTGIVVDEVSEVMNIKAADIEETPAFGESASIDYVLGMAKMGSGIKILLDIDKVLNADTAERLRASVQA